MDYTQTVADNIRFHAARKSVTHRKIAEILGVNYATASRKLNGKTLPLNVRQLSIIAEHLDMDPADFFKTY